MAHARQRDIDFSCGDWPRLYKPKDGLGSVQWVRLPPSVVWAPETAFGWQGSGTPEVGEFWYCPWAGPVPPFFLSERESLSEANVFTDLIKRGIDNYHLTERAKDARDLPLDAYQAKWRHTMKKKELA